jgi:pectate lyase
MLSFSYRPSVVFSVFLFLITLFAVPMLVWAQSACHLLTSPDPAPDANYSVPYDVFSSARELLLSGSCTSNSIQVTAGISGATHIVAKQGYELRSGSWSPITYTGSTYSGDNNWLQGVGVATLSRTSTELQTPNYVIAYSCTLVAGQWKCGCNDTSCTVNKWQVQAFERSGSVSLPIVTLSASPTSITAGGSSTLNWTSTNATSCTASGGWSGTKALNDTQSVSPTTNTTYTLACTGSGGSDIKSVTVSVAAAGPVKAFPTAEGFGKDTLGGRGGAVYHVTNLNDSGSGSLRTCVEATGPRTCVFRVGGTIILQSSLLVANPYLTIAGQTAPGDGIQIRYATAVTTPRSPISVRADHVIIRYIRVRSHRPTGVNNRDALDIISAKNVIVDHSSIQWGPDSNTDVWSDWRNITLQWNLYAGSARSITVGAKDGLGPATGISYHHNLSVHNSTRTPKLGLGISDMVNNVSYNWRAFGGAHIGSADGPADSNIVNNFWKKGLDTGVGDEFKEINKIRGRAYLQGNIGPNRPNNSLPEDALVKSLDGSIVSTPFSAPSITTTSAVQAYEDVLAGAGATLPRRDSVDTRLVNDVRNGTGRYTDSPSDADRWAILNSGTPYPDADGDGMSDTWETANGLNPGSAGDRNGDINGNGYTNLEDFINELAGDF